MKYIQITKGQKCLVDDDDFDWLSKWSWHLITSGYAARRKTVSNKKTVIALMHREIIKTPAGLHTDHINGSKLDNRKCNLRVCTKSENGMGFNPKLPGTSSKFIGVNWSKRAGKWIASYKLNSKRKHIGTFSTETEAAIARDNAVFKRNPNFCNLNFPIATPAIMQPSQ